MKNSNYTSLVYFKDSKVVNASNDGMELLGNFLLTQVGTDKASFFTRWLSEKVNDAITSGHYFVEKMGDQVRIDHLQNNNMSSFESSKANVTAIIKQWNLWCRSDGVSACSFGGKDVSISRSLDGDSFDFYVDKSKVN